jgi:hypothetical protein
VVILDKNINYYRAISNSYNCTIQETEQYEAQNALLYDFDNNPSCKDVLLNGEPTKVLIYIETNIITGGQSYKVVRKPNEVLNIGDILVIDDETWFVTKVDPEKLITYKGSLAKAVCTLKFYKDGILRELPCYINVGTRNYINEKDNDILRLPTSLYTAYCPDLGYLNKYDAGIRFVIKDYVYRAIGIDNLTVLDGEMRDGLIIIKLKDDAMSHDDNMELGIANYWSNQIEQTIIKDETVINNNYKIKINIDKDFIYLGETLPILYDVTDLNDNIIDDVQCDISVSDEQNNPIDYIEIVSINNIPCLKATTKGIYVDTNFKLSIRLQDNNNNSVVTTRYFNIRNII